jgi:DNA-binding CsgD family transcriptional regulator
MCIHLTEDEKRYIFDNYDKKSAKEIADWIGCTVCTVNFHLKKRGLKSLHFSKWSSEKKRELLTLRCNGATRKELAERFGVTESAIHNQIRLMRQSGINIPTQWDVRLIRKQLMKYSVSIDIADREDKQGVNFNKDNKFVSYESK